MWRACGRCSTGTHWSRRLREQLKDEQFVVRDLFCDDYVFRFPPYQRPYRWGSRHAEALLNDILEGSGTEGKVDELPPYFIGSIVLSIPRAWRARWRRHGTFESACRDSVDTTRHGNTLSTNGRNVQKCLRSISRVPSALLLAAWLFLMKTNRNIACTIIGLIIGGAGVAHFTNASLFEGLVPDSLGSYRSLINVSTAFLMIAMGLAFMIPRFRVFARWSGVVLLVATLPPAINQVAHPEGIIAAGLSPAVAAMRVAAQVGMVAMIWWATKEDNPQEMR